MKVVAASVARAQSLAYEYTKEETEILAEIFELIDKTSRDGYHSVSCHVCNQKIREILYKRYGYKIVTHDEWMNISW